MSRSRIAPVAVSVAFAALVLVTGALGSPSTQAAITTVAVTAGKPTEFKYTLSRTVVPTGTVVLRVTNRGQIAHDFKIVGKKTATLATGKAGTLRAVFAKPGRYAYLCTLAGHAAAGMKGVLTVKQAAPIVTVTAGKPTELCYTLSKSIVATGPIAFKVTNKGSMAHDFKIAGKKTVKLAAGKTATLQLTIARAGRYAYLCTLAGHAAAGMKGVLTVKQAAPIVTVTAGKPTELRYTLSKTIVPKGPIAFKVTNKGKVAHDFKIAGKKTVKLAAGKTATLQVTIARAGRYAYLCTLPGHAAAGMKGVLRVN
ncbi:MAG TPA: cupredoxin domain-containing protein [Gaiellaceae bacterium]|nr:cupredoxin domain-containing protein [Gaiellaceae bacterium]